MKDKTSILSLGQIIKMCYCRIHARSCARTCLNGSLPKYFFRTNGELSYKSNKYVWAYRETWIDLEVSPTVWSGFNLLITAYVSAQSGYFSLSNQRYLKRFKPHGSLIQAANTLIRQDGFSGWPNLSFLELIKINMFFNQLHLDWNQVGTARFFQPWTFFFKTKIGQLSVTGLSNEKQSKESTNNCFRWISLVSLSVFLFGHSKHSSVYMLV